MLSSLAKASCSRTPFLPLASLRAPILLSPSSIFPRQLQKPRFLTTTSIKFTPTPSKSLQAATTTPHALTDELISPAPSSASATSSPAIAPPTILDKILPKWAEPAKPYLLLTRIDKPIGSILLFWPCAWSITMASTIHNLPISTPLFYISLFALGSVIMRGAGCTINDMWDMKFDKAVERTRWRPLANGDVTMTGAGFFLVGQLGMGLAVLSQLNMYSIILGASSMGLVTIYPFMKRITYYPHAVLGLAFNWGALLGWSAVAGSVDWNIALPMYVGGVAWCVMYDTIYAHQDKKDDIQIGVKSIALRFPDTSRRLISGLSATFVSLLTLTGHLAGLGPLYYAISCAGAAAHLSWQCATVNFDSRSDLWAKFCSNGWLGGLVWVGIAADYVQRVLLGF